MVTDAWKNDRYVKRWLRGLSERTKENYKGLFPHFLDFIKMTPTEIVTKRMHDLTTEDITERQFFEDKWRAYKEAIEKKAFDYRGSSVTTMLTPVASFFTRNGLPLALHRGDWKPNVTQQPRKKLKLALDDVKRMYGHANLRDKALLLVLAQSGFSEADVAEFKVEHLKGLYDMPQAEHYYIEKCREKTGFEQATCISYEALHDIREMLFERGNPTEGYLFVSQTKDKGSQMTTRTINEAMKTLAERTFGEKKAKEFNTKTLRSFYNSALLKAHVTPQEIKDVMMGHKRQGARGHYAYDEDTIREWYAKAFENLSINGIQSREDFAKFREDTNKMIGKLTVENEQMKQQIKEMPSKIREEIEKLLPELKKLYS